MIISIEITVHLTIIPRLPVSNKKSYLRNDECNEVYIFAADRKSLTQTESFNTKNRSIEYPSSKILCLPPADVWISLNELQLANTCKYFPCSLKCKSSLFSNVFWLYIYFPQICL